MYKVDLAFKKKKETKLECYADSCGKFELTIAENTLKYLPKEQHIYSARCSSCKKAIAVKAKELLSFRRVFGDFEIVTTKSTFDNLFEVKKQISSANCVTALKLSVENEQDFALLKII